MTAIAERPAVVERIAADHPLALEWMNRYLSSHGLSIDNQPPNKEWFVYRCEERVLVIFGLIRYTNAAIEGTDFYMEPSKQGFVAGLAVLEYFKHLVESKQVPYIVTSSFYQNKRFARLWKRVYNVDPACVIFTFPGKLEGQ